MSLERDISSATANIHAPGAFPPRWTWPELAILALILVTAAFLRFYRIGQHSFWNDELYTVESVNGTTLAGTWAVPHDVILNPAPTPTQLSPAAPWWRILRPDPYDVHPPLFYLFTRAWVTLASYTEAGFRSHAVLWSLCALLLLHLTVRWRTGSAAVALWATAMMALAELQVKFAQNARSYPMFESLALAACLLMTSIERRGPSRWRWGSLVVVLAAALLTHYEAAAVVVVLAVYAFVFPGGRPRLCVASGGAAAIALFAVLWGRGLWTQFHTHGFRDQPVFHDTAAHHIAATFNRFAGLPSQFISEPLPNSQRIAAIAFLLLPVSLLVAWRWPQRRRETIFWLLWFFGITLPVLWADLSRGSERLELLWFTIIASPAVYVLIAALGQSWRPPLRHAFSAIATFGCAVGLPLAYEHGLRPDWRRFGAAVAAMAKPGDLIIVAAGTADIDTAGAVQMRDALYTCGTHYARPLRGPIMVLSGPPTPELLDNLDHYGGGGIVVISSDCESDGIYPMIQETALRRFPHLADIYRFKPTHPGPPSP
jgi:4-amino-4-deoxy-L-arabinose transferase-like glycosyltransferase